MNSKVYIYIISTLITAYTLTGINFNNFFKKNKEIESKIFIIIISLIGGYLLTNFIVDFLGASKII